MSCSSSAADTTGVTARGRPPDPRDRRGRDRLIEDFLHQQPPRPACDRPRRKLPITNDFSACVCVMLAERPALEPQLARVANPRALQAHRGRSRLLRPPFKSVAETDRLGGALIPPRLRNSVTSSSSACCKTAASQPTDHPTGSSSPATPASTSSSSQRNLSLGATAPSGRTSTSFVFPEHSGGARLLPRHAWPRAAQRRRQGRLPLDHRRRRRPARRRDRPDELPQRRPRRSRRARRAARQGRPERRSLQHRRPRRHLRAVARRGRRDRAGANRSAVGHAGLCRARSVREHGAHRPAAGRLIAGDRRRLAVRRRLPPGGGL